MIITLAGHVDHGKTTLVRLLTGKDTDRLAEEKRRGLTIDLGFAYLEHDGRTLGFVDVPGHHRFIHNMVAGVAARQHALLVVAADDGPMPQSREHLQILDLIGVRDGVVALTKCDRVDPARRAAARAEIGALVAGTFLEHAPLVETSATEPAGIDTLRTALLGLPDAAGAGERPFRMAVDRAFTLKGTGVVVTGTVHNGAVRVDDTLHLFPKGTPVRVRGVHAQDRPADAAEAGDRAALNLAGVSADQITRGDWLTLHRDPGHRSVVLELRVLEDFPRALRHWTPVHVYHASRHSTAHVALLQGSRLEPGATGLAELVCDQPLLAKHGDRVVIRDHGLDTTLGGGTVVDNRPPPGRRRARGRLESIDALRSTSPADALQALLATGPVATDDFRNVWDLSHAELDALLAGQSATLRDGTLVADALWERWRAALLDECEARHRSDPALQGLQQNELAAAVPERFRGLLLRELTGTGELVQRAGRFQPTRHEVALTAAEAALHARLAPLLDQTQPPSLGDLGKQLRIPLAALKQTVGALASKRRLVLINDKRLYLPERVLPLAAVAAELARAGPFTARDFRDAAQVGRNVAVDLLEFFDARGFTRRNGDTRTVVAEPHRVLP